MKKSITILLSFMVLIHFTGAAVDPAPVDVEENLSTYATRPGDGLADIKINTGETPVKQYFRVKVKKTPADVWAIQLGRKLKTEVNEGDTCYLVFYARATANLSERKYGQVTALVEMSGPPWNKLLLQRVNIQPGWNKYVIPFIARKSWGNNPKRHYAPGEAHVAFNFGAGQQEIEIGPVAFCNLGKNPDRSTVPMSDQTYEGREADAPWRKNADDRIEKLRKTAVSINVTDAAGVPLRDAVVTVKMQRHAFPFGSCINLSTWNQQDSDGARYREEFRKLFNMAVFEGAMKWRAGWDYTDSLRNCVGWLKQNNIDVRGHCLVWPSWNSTPPFVKNFQNDRENLRRIVRDHIYYEAGMLKNDVVEWDVINEVYANNEILRVLGNDIMVDWFKVAHDAAPSAKLYANDYDILTTADNPSDSHRKAFLDMAAELKKKGAPIDGLGMQSHFCNPVAPQDMLDTIDNMAKLGLELKITEYDFASFDEKLKADFTRDLLTVAFSHPAIKGFLMWGFWDGQHWNSDAPLYFKDWSLKPSGKVYKDLVFGKWWTNVSGKTDAAGKFDFRGFKGSYQVIIEYQGRKKQMTADLSNSTSSLKIEL